MTKIIFSLWSMLFLSACTSQAPQPAIGPGPFIGIDLAKLPPEDRQIITEASEDFRAVVAGKKPMHAVFDKNADLPSDGGTTFYKGRGYNLTVLLSISSFGDFSGNAYGPIVTFDSTFAPGNTSEISDIRVYSSDELRKFLVR